MGKIIDGDRLKPLLKWKDNLIFSFPNMVLEPVHCPDCDGTEVIQHGTTSAGKQCYRCQNSACCRNTFIQAYSSAYLPHVKPQITEMAINGSGTRAVSRMLGVSPTTVMATLKKKSSPQSGE
jgi:transposase-like protein